MKKILITLLLIPALNYSSDTTVSVSYFTDLSGSDPQNRIGKAIAEFLTSDLAAIKGLTFVERSSLEKVLSEMELSMSGITSDSAAPGIGKLLGAELIITGSYLFNEGDCVISFKVIKTATAEILKSGTVSGSKNRIGTLIRSLSLSAAAALRELHPEIDISALSAPKEDGITLESAKNFGTALDMGDRGRHAEAADILKKLIQTNPGYHIFRAALADLEKRIKEYDKAREEAIAREAKQPATWNGFMKLSTSYITAMKFTLLYELCVKLRKNPPQIPEGYIMESAEMIDYYIIAAVQGLSRHPETISEGEIFLSKYPASVYYQTVKTFMRLAADSISDEKKNRLNLPAEFSAIDKECAGKNESFRLYKTGLHLYSKKFYRDAAETFAKVRADQLEQYGINADSLLYYVFQCYVSMPDKKKAEKALRTMEFLYPDSDYLRGMKIQADYIAE